MINSVLSGERKTFCIYITRGQDLSQLQIHRHIRHRAHSELNILSCTTSAMGWKWTEKKKKIPGPDLKAFLILSGYEFLIDLCLQVDIQTSRQIWLTN